MNEREIFCSALDLDEDRRRDFLDAACGRDTALRAQVESLIKSHAAAGDFLSIPAVQQVSERLLNENSSTISCAVNLNETAPKPTSNLKSTDHPNEDDSLDFLEPSTNSDSLGRLKHYEILAVIGRGAFGTVLKAFDEILHRVVAIKVISTELAATSFTRKRFLREARASASIRHDNVVNIYSVDENPIPHLVMEYIPGQTLQHMLDANDLLDIQRILQFGQQIAGGLSAAHGQGLIHRDIKPANILIEDGPEERVKITDFGLARESDDVSSTQVGIIAGTPLFMSPEQAQALPIDERTDLFSLGSVLYLMTSGRTPFQADSMAGVLKRVVEETPRPIREFNPAAPVWLCAIISKLHAKRPEDRFGSAIVLAELLGRCLSDVRRQVVPTLPELGPLPEQRWQFARSRKTAIVVAGFLIAVAVVNVATITGWKRTLLDQMGMTEVVPNSNVAPRDPIELGPLLTTSNCVANGSISDCSYNGSVLALNGAVHGCHLWLNFFDAAGEILTIQTELRVLNPEQDGFVKLIFLPNQGLEVFAIVSVAADEHRIWIEAWSKGRRPEDGIPVPIIGERGWIDLKYVVSRNRYELFVDGELVLTSPRETAVAGHVAIGCGNWNCEFRRPRVLIGDDVKSLR